MKKEMKIYIPVPDGIILEDRHGNPSKRILWKDATDEQVEEYFRLYRKIVNERRGK